MIKVADWQIHLHKYLKENRDRDFKWGDWDCCVFADGAIHSISGVHVIPEELTWDNESAAMESIQEYGRTFANAIKKAAKLSGLEPIDNAQITAGDLCVYMNDNEEVCGICDGYALVSPAEQGYAFNRCDTVRIAWRVPNG